MSELKVNTISEQSSGNGVTIDSVPVKDGAVGTTTTPITVNANSLNGGQFSGRRNLIFNPEMKLALRATTKADMGSVEGYYVHDRWQHSVGNTSGRYTWTQETITDLAGFGNAMKLACTTADTSVATNERLIIKQSFEGQDVQGLQKGFSTAKKIAVSFYVKGNASATYTVELSDTDNTRYNGQTFNVTTDWTRVSVVFNADTTCKLTNDSNKSLDLNFWLHAGSDFTSGTFTSNVWHTSATQRVGGSTSFFDSTSRTFFLTGVQMEISDIVTPFEFVNIADDLYRCRRYFQQNQASWYGVYQASGYFESDGISYNPVMRDTPSVSQKSFTGGSRASSSSSTSNSSSGITIYTSPSSAGGNEGWFATWEADAEI